MKKALLWINLVVLGLLIFSGCSSKKSDPPPTPSTKGHTVKFTVTVIGSVAASNAGLINLGFGGGDATNPQNSTIWKLNTVVQNNESNLVFNATTFPQGKTTTITIESVVPIFEPVAGLTFGNVSGFTPYTISFKAEIDGQVKTDDENISITAANEYIHTYSYQ